MKAETRKSKYGLSICDIYSDVPIVANPDDFKEILGTASLTSDSKSILINSEAFSTDFYNLESGLMGHILKLLSDYGYRMSVYGDFGSMNIKRYLDYLGESTPGTDFIFFVPDINQGMEMLERSSRPLGAEYEG